MPRGEYDAVYRKPERQPDLRRLEEDLICSLRGHDVLELTCGTGYWTERYAKDAASVLGVDASAEMLQLAKDRFAPGGKVEFHFGAVFALPDFGRAFSACFCGFFWSHIPLGRLPGFLHGLRTSLTPGTLLVFIDNRFVAGSNTPLSRTDAAGDTYQTRPLENGSSHEVLKNFPDAAALQNALSEVATEVRVSSLKYFWMASGRLRPFESMP